MSEHLLLPLMISIAEVIMGFEYICDVIEEINGIVITIVATFVRQKSKFS